MPVFILYSWRKKTIPNKYHQKTQRAFFEIISKYDLNLGFFSTEKCKWPQADNQARKLKK